VTTSPSGILNQDYTVQSTNEQATKYGFIQSAERYQKLRACFSLLSCLSSPFPVRKRQVALSSLRWGLDMLDNLQILRWALQRQKVLILPHNVTSFFYCLTKRETWPFILILLVHSFVFSNRGFYSFPKTLSFYHIDCRDQVSLWEPRLILRFAFGRPINHKRRRCKINHSPPVSSVEVVQPYIISFKRDTVRKTRNMGYHLYLRKFQISVYVLFNQVSRMVLASIFVVGFKITKPNIYYFSGPLPTYFASVHIFLFILGRTRCTVLRIIFYSSIPN
jgi:hypothetical protein